MRGAMMDTLEPIIQEHNFFIGLKPDLLKMVVGCASNVVFDKKQVIFKEGDQADKLYLIRSGRVAIYICHPQKVTIQTLWEGDILGWSWLVAPFEYRLTAEAIEKTQAIIIDAKCLRKKCEEDKVFGYEVMKRLASVITQRLEATMYQICDLFQ